MDLGIKGRVALVLAASKGLGRAGAAALAAEGVQIVIGSRNMQMLEKTAQDIRLRSMAVLYGQYSNTLLLASIVKNMHHSIIWARCCSLDGQ